MATLPLRDIEALLDGCVDIRRRATAIQPLRLPFAERDFYDPFTRWVASCAAGVRIRFSTTSRRVRLRATQRTLATPVGGERRGAYDLFVDDAFHARDWGVGGAAIALGGALSGDEAILVDFNDLPPGEKLIEVWLPQAAMVSLTGLEIDDDATIAPAPDTRPRIVFHGGSITHCMEAEGASAGWPAVASRLAGASHLNLGWAGSCLISGLAARLLRDARADAIVLKLGINVYAEGMLKERTFLDSVHAMISIIREKHPRTPMLVVSPIFSPAREQVGDAGGPSLQRMRALLEEIVAVRVAAGDRALSYLSGLALFSPADAHLLPDDLHPNTQGHLLMGERFHASKLAGAHPLLRAPA